jgi:bifunctional DNA-binding transcriptional regulator/antitoxin component of YhaV-PrlF toxin-antitoxin module
MKQQKTSMYSNPVIQIFIKDHYRVSISNVITEKLGIKIGERINLESKEDKIYLAKSKDSAGFKLSKKEVKSIGFRSKKFMFLLDDTIHFLKNEGTSYIFDVDLETMEITFNRARKNK